MGREDFLRQYQASELDPNWIRRVASLASKGWKEFVAKEKEDIRELRQTIQTQQGELDTLRLTAAEHQALQVRWGQDTQSLDALRQELVQARTALAQERERREHAEAEALRATVRLSTLEPLLAQLQPTNAGGKGSKRISSEETPAP